MLRRSFKKIKDKTIKTFKNFKGIKSIKNIQTMGMSADLDPLVLLGYGLGRATRYIISHKTKVFVVGGLAAKIGMDPALPVVAFTAINKALPVINKIAVAHKRVDYISPADYSYFDF
jgi:hypothetical protein